MKKRFLERVKKYIPATIINLKSIEKKLFDVKVVSGDYLLYSDFTEADGDYDPKNNTAVILTGEVGLFKEPNNKINHEDYQEYVYTHEMFHAISGLSVLSGTVNPEVIKKLRLQRMGLLTKGKFRWLNEAMTERLTLKVLELPDSNYYKNERELLQMMINKGVSEEFLWRLTSMIQNQQRNHPILKI